MRAAVRAGVAWRLAMPAACLAGGGGVLGRAAVAADFSIRPEGGVNLVGDGTDDGTWVCVLAGYYKHD